MHHLHGWAVEAARFIRIDQAYNPFQQMIETAPDLTPG